MAQTMHLIFRDGRLIKDKVSGLEKKVSGVSVQVSEQREVPSQPLVAGAALGIS